MGWLVFPFGALTLAGATPACVPRLPCTVHRAHFPPGTLLLGPRVNPCTPHTCPMPAMMTSLAVVLHLFCCPVTPVAHLFCAKYVPGCTGSVLSRPTLNTHYLSSRRLLLNTHKNKQTFLPACESFNYFSCSTDAVYIKKNNIRLKGNISNSFYFNVCAGGEIIKHPLFRTLGERMAGL